jgi:RNA polymerase sigma factor (sigma-70 family)
MRRDEVARIAHDPDVFEVFYREHIDAVQRFVARRIRDPHLAADLTAEVFLAAIAAAASYRPRRGAPGLWLFGVARNVVNNELRRAAREKQVNARFQGRQLLADDDIVRAQERIDAEARSRELYAALYGLTDAERAVFELIALDGLSASEAATALGIRPVTARVRLHRARHTLRTELGSQEAQQLTTSMEVSP